MAKRGRKPTPRNLRLITGDTRPSRMNADEPEVPVSAPDPPDYLDDNEAEKFRELAHKLAKMRVMTEADIDALAICARAHIEANLAHESVKAMGLMVKTKAGNPIQNPYLAIRNAAEKKALGILTEFGLTPSSRTRVNKS